MSEINSLPGPLDSDGLGEGRQTKLPFGNLFTNIQFSFLFLSGASDLLVMNCKEMGGEVVFAVCALW